MTDAAGNEQTPRPASASGDAIGPAPRDWLKAAVIALAVSAVVWSAGYLSVTVRGNWFSSAPAQRFVAAQMKITRGTGVIEKGNFIVAATDPAGIAVVTVDRPNIDAANYRRIRWRVQSVDPEVTLVFAWRTDSAPGQTLTAPLVQYGGDLYVAHPERPAWSGRIEGIALTVHGKLRQPFFIEAVTIDSMDAGEVIADRIQDWFGFQHWSGLSINAAIGGPQEQPVWMPIAVSMVAVTAIAIVALRGRRRMTPSARKLAITAIVVLAWIVLDARWLWQRIQQTESTASVFAGKTPRDKHVSDVDGYVYAFAEQVITRLPKTPVRIHVASDDQYFGGRMAYHLYPHNANMNRENGGLPSPDRVKAGEYLVVFRRAGVLYDPANRMLTWDQHPAVPVDILIAHQGNAAFRVRGPS